MIISSNKDNNIIKTYYDSSNVIYSEYNEPNNELLITFVKGNTYRYHNVDVSTFNKLQLSESIGNAIFKYLKEYKFDNLGNVKDVKLLIEQSKTIKSDDFKKELEIRKNNLKVLFEKSMICMEHNSVNCLFILEELNKENVKIIELLKTQTQ